MKRFLTLAFLLLFAVPCFGQLVLTANLAGQVNAPIDQNGWQNYKVTLTQNITFSFVIIPPNPPPAQATLAVIFTQDNVGSHTVTFASNISSPCTISVGANLTTICQFKFDGTSNTWIGISSGGLNSIGAATNVKTLGAVGNGKFFVDGVVNGSNNQLTSATAVFSASDVGQLVNCINNSNAEWAAGTASTVTTFVNSSTITYSGTNAGSITGLFCTLLNPADSAAILSAFNACKTTFQAPRSSVTYQQPGCKIYLPAGIYGVSTTLDNLIVSGAENCVGIEGDTMGKSILIPTAGFTVVAHGNGGWFINDVCNGGYLKNFTVEAARLPIGTAGEQALINFTSTNSLLQDVDVLDQNWTGGGNSFGIAVQGGSNVVLRSPRVEGGANSPGGLFWNGAEGDIFSPFLSNTANNLLVQNTTSGANGSGVRFWGGIIDEGSVPTVQASIDLWFMGITFTGGANCLSVDATSIVNVSGGYCGTFGGNTGGGITVASGGKALISNMHVNAVNAGSACYTSAAYGGIVDDGTNRCTTSGGGTVYPAGGIVNQLSLSHAQANAFQSGTLAAGTVQSFAVDQPIAVSSITWTPGNAFACTASSFPTLSATDGTVTVTTAATDTSTNGAVTHTFPNTTASVLNPSGTVGTVIQIKVVTTGTCGTAPTNTNINLFWQATAPVL